MGTLTVGLYVRCFIVVLGLLYRVGVVLGCEENWRERQGIVDIMRLEGVWMDSGELLEL